MATSAFALPLHIAACPPPLPPCRSGDLRHGLERRLKHVHWGASPRTPVGCPPAPRHSCCRRASPHPRDCLCSTRTPHLALTPAASRTQFEIALYRKVASYLGWNDSFVEWNCMDWDVMLGECHEGCCSEQSGSSLSPSGSQPAPRPPSPATLPARKTPPPAPPPPPCPHQTTWPRGTACATLLWRGSTSAPTTFKGGSPSRGPPTGEERQQHWQQQGGDGGCQLQWHAAGAAPPVPVPGLQHLFAPAAHPPVNNRNGLRILTKTETQSNVSYFAFMEAFRCAVCSKAPELRVRGRGGRNHADAHRGRAAGSLTPVPPPPPPNATRCAAGSCGAPSC